MMGRKKGILYTLGGVLVAAIAVAVFVLRDGLSLPTDPIQARLVILERIPIGMNVDSAQRLMERGRFECLLESNLRDSSSPWGRRVYCSKTRWGGLGDWRVSLYLGPDNRVADVYVTFDIPAP